MKVSVIVPVYNVEKYLDKCLTSIEKQNFEEYEVLVVIDGTEDGSEKIARKYEKAFPERFRVIVQENKGLGGARNTGIREAKGEYLAFVDSDDIVHPDFLKDTYAKAEEEAADIVVSDIEYVDESGRSLRCEPAKLGNSDEIQFDKKSKILMWPGAWNKIYKRELFVKDNIFYPERLWYEDLATTPKVILNADKIAYIPKAYYYYLQREGSIMSSKNIARNKEIITAFEKIADFFEEHGVYQEYKVELEFLAIYHILYTAAVRINKVDASSRIQEELVDYVQKRFPGYMKNFYLKVLMSKKEKIVIHLLSKKSFKTLNTMFRLVEKMK